MLRPAEELRYSPGSLLVIASASEPDREALAERVIEQKGAVLTTGKVRSLLAGRVPDEEMDAKAAELLNAAVAKRLGANESTVVVTGGLDPEERDRFARLAAAAKRPRHLILLETARDQVGEDDLAPAERAAPASRRRRAGRRGLRHRASARRRVDRRAEADRLPPGSPGRLATP